MPGAKKLPKDLKWLPEGTSDRSRPNHRLSFPSWDFLGVDILDPSILLLVSALDPKFLFLLSDHCPPIL